jgi:proline dehydrogenase
MEATFFGHFCAGEDEHNIRPTVDYLQRNGVGSILDYAAEADIDDDNANGPTTQPSPPSSPEATVPTVAGKERVQCRVYDYKNEELCDMHARTFEKCIRAVKSVSPTGFAAIKCTALGNP